MKKVYLDYAATSPCELEVVEEMRDYWDRIFGNPSSMHSWGEAAQNALQESRAKVAWLIGAKPEEIVFTSGGTESNNTAIKSVAWAYSYKGNHIISSAIEHPSVLESLKFLEKTGLKVTLLEVDRFGRIDTKELEKSIGPHTILISVMHANNEIGTIEPIEEVAAIARKRGIVLHTDAVQTIGHIPLDVKDLGIDLLSSSAHKFYGPKGIGFLYIKKGTKMAPLIHGGGQEKGRRSSTENIPSIVGLRKALEISIGSIQKEIQKISSLRDRLKEEIRKNIPQVSFNGHPEHILPNSLSFSVKNIDGEALAMRLNMEGIACSTGSACSSEKGLPSYTLQAIGLKGELLRGAIRFSLGRQNNSEDIEYCAKVLKKEIEELRRISPL